MTEHEPADSLPLAGEAAQPLNPASGGPAEAEPDVEKAGEGRDKAGRFARGNKAGRGNPFNRRLAEMRRTFVETVSADDLARLARGLLERALAGDNAAAALLLSYVVGKPQRAVDPDDLDAAELRALLAGPTVEDVSRAALNAAEVGQALGVLQRALDGQDLRADVARQAQLALLRQFGLGKADE